AAPRARRRQLWLPLPPTTERRPPPCLVLPAVSCLRQGHPARRRSARVPGRGCGQGHIVTGLRALAAIAFLAPSGVSAAEAPRHLIYLHGRIVQEQQNSRPQHPEFGYYELEKILEAFRQRGFVVSSEIRPKANSVSQSADHVVEQVRQLLHSGVAAE